MTIHHTMGVYPNGDRKHNGVAREDLKDHIQYNLDMRPGRAFFVDGVCHNRGYLSQSKIDAVTSELRTSPMLMKKCTAPYQ